MFHVLSLLLSNIVYHDILFTLKKQKNHEREFFYFFNIKTIIIFAAD